jgi:lipopolysaccharide/colanic/teichoic acid biosynthesis glycosyltransferase
MPERCPDHPWQRRAKRVLDVTVAAAGLAVTSPITATVAIAIRFRLGSPVIFRQVRPGKDGAPFTLYKFRTMRDAVDRHGHPLSDEERLTPLGRTLRRFSLDELPQLVNVLHGDISLVGPRPLLMEYLPRYTPAQARRHEVRPGITGWAQVNGRNAISWEQKFAYDVWYVEHWSLWLDLKILWRTASAVARREGISSPGAATMPVFTGTAARELVADDDSPDERVAAK